jgi:hypothetical protein
MCSPPRRRRPPVVVPLLARSEGDWRLPAPVACTPVLPPCVDRPAVVVPVVVPLAA